MSYASFILFSPALSAETSDPGDCNAIKEMQITIRLLFFLSARIWSDVWYSFQKTVSNANLKNLNIAHHEVSKPHEVPPMICLRTLQYGHILYLTYIAVRSTMYIENT